MRRIVITVGVLVVVAVLIVIILPSLIRVDRYRPQIEAKLKDKLGRYWCKDCADADARAKKREEELRCPDCGRVFPDHKLVYFQTDRHGKLAIYDMHVEKLVEKTDLEGQ